MTNEAVFFSEIKQRKDRHLQICLEADVRSDLTNGFERYRLIPNAAPEADFSAFSTARTFLDREISFPLLISSMTGGTERGALINRNLCIAAEARRVALALGSLRVYLASNDVHSLSEIRRSAPTVPILANIGAVQLNTGMETDDIRKLIESIEADGLIFHFNPLQELIQPGGDRDFSDFFRKLAAIRKRIPVPLIAKEVGFGFSVETARRLIEAGFDWIDAAGAGGTSWAKVEMYARGEDPNESVYAPFGKFGLPTADCVAALREAFPALPLIASGGIRDGVEMRKAELLGARLSGVALPFLAPALTGPDAVCALIDRLEVQYRSASFVSSGIEKIQV